MKQGDKKTHTPEETYLCSGQQQIIDRCTGQSEQGDRLNTLSTSAATTDPKPFAPNKSLKF